MLSSKALLPLFLVVAVAGPPCKETRDPPPRPSCTDECLEAGDVKGICLNNLREICTAEATDEYFSQHDDCFVGACANEDDLYTFIETFKKECDASKKPMKKMGGKIGEYFAELEDERKTTSTWKPGESTSKSGGDKTTTQSSATKTTSEILKPSSTITKPSTIIVTSVTTEDPKSTETATSTTPNQPAPPTTSAPPPTESREPPIATSATLSTSSPFHTTATPTTHPPHSPKKERPLSTGEIVGVTAGGIAGLAITIGVIIFLIVRRRRRASVISEPQSMTPIVRPSYTTDRFGNAHASEWTGTPQYGGGGPGAPAATSEVPGGFAQRAFMHRNAGLGTNF